MRQSDVEIRSIGALVDRLSEDVPDDQPTWFRGMANRDWRLEPSLARHGGIDLEIPLIKRFKQNALPHMSSRPENEWEWLFVMQHHGLPTRLLDWTENALVALYFVVNDVSPEARDNDGALWAILPVGLNADSKYGPEYERDIPSFGDDDHLDSYLPSVVTKQRVEFGPLAAIALRNTLRMQMQQGVFTVNHKELTALDSNGGGDYLWRYIIPGREKQKVRRELRLLGIEKLTLFPELANVAERAKDIT